MARVAARLRGEPDDVRQILPYEEVIAALGFVSERSIGAKVVPLDEIVGTVDRTREYDRNFRPTSGRVRSRWEGIAAAMRRGESLPPVDLLRIGEIYFVRDGHHRVSVARALGRTDIDAFVTEVVTRVGAEQAITYAQLPFKTLERVFFERVPLPDHARAEIQLSDSWDYARLAEHVEAWGFRTSQERGEAINRRETAYLWLENEYRPVVEMLREADLIGSWTDDRGLHASQRPALSPAADPPLGRGRHQGHPRRPAAARPPPALSPGGQSAPAQRHHASSTRRQLSQAIASRSAPAKPASLSASSSRGVPPTSPSSAGIVAPS